MKSNEMWGEREDRVAEVIHQEETRRTLFGKAGLVAGGIGLASLAHADVATALGGVEGFNNVKDPPPGSPPGTLSGARGDGTTDDTAAIQAWIDASGADGSKPGILHFPPGRYKVTSTITISKSVTLLGAGFGADANSINSAELWKPATEIKWAGSAGGTMIQLGDGTGTRGVLRGAGIEGFGLNGGFGPSRPARGIKSDRLQFSVIRDLGIRGLASGGIGLHCLTNAPATGDAQDTTQGWASNLVEQLSIDAPIGIQMDGNATDTTETADCHNNTFTEVSIIHDDTTNGGLRILGADNNTFLHLRLYRASGTAYGIEFGDRGRQNYMFHVLAGDGGVVCRTPDNTDWSNVIFGYDRGNGQPVPVLETSAQLEWSETGKNAAGWRVKKLALGGTHSPNTSLDIASDLALRSTGTPLSNGANHNVSTADRTYLRITGPTAAFDITGFANGSNGKLIIVRNSTTQTMTIKHEDTGSSASNRVHTNDGSNISKAGEGQVGFIYDSVLARWVPLWT